VTGETAEKRKKNISVEILEDLRKLLISHLIKQVTLLIRAWIVTSFEQSLILLAKI